jgi:hypothetical protein
MDCDLEIAATTRSSGATRRTSRATTPDDAEDAIAFRSRVYRTFISEERHQGTRSRRAGRAMSLISVRSVVNEDPLNDLSLRDGGTEGF